MKPFKRPDIISIATPESLMSSFITMLPNGPYWDWKKYPESNLYQFLLGVLRLNAPRYNALFFGLWREMDLMQTVQFLPVFEQNVGLPNQLLKTEGQTLERRRLNVIQQLRPIQLISRQDYIDLLLIAGYELGVHYIDIVNGWEGYTQYEILYNSIYNVEILSQAELDEGTVYIILKNGSLDNENIINIIKPLIPLYNVFKQIYI